MRGSFAMRRIYMDHTAGMPVDPRVFEAMKPYFEEVYGNPSSLYSFAREARKALEDARERSPTSSVQRRMRRFSSRQAPPRATTGRSEAWQP